MAKLRALFLRRRLERGLDAELAFHREMSAERGSPHRFGNDLRVREQAREAWMFTWVESLGQDLRYAARSLRRAPGFAAAVVIVLALGIGANSAIFSLAYAVLWQPLPYPDAGRLVEVQQKNVRLPRANANSSLDISLARQQNTGLEDWSMYRLSLATLTGAGQPVMLDGATIEAGVLAALGAKPLAGRLLAPNDDRPHAPPAVMISASLWRQRWNASAAAVGKPITLDGKSYTLVGVLPDEFGFPEPSTGPIAAWHVSFWLAWQEAPEGAGNRDARSVARLAPEVGLAQAQQRLNKVMQQLGQTYAQDKSWTFQLTPLRTAVAGNAAPALWMMLAVTGLVLLIAAANVACLLAARAQRRRHELATRAALGASRRRIARQLWTETALLIALGAGTGLALAAGGIAWLRATAPASMPRLAQVGLRWPVVAFTAGIAVVVALVFGLAPAWRATGRMEASRQPARTVTAAQGGHGRSLWVIAQVALSLLLLAGAGLMLTALLRMRGVQLGFTPDHTLTFTLSLPPQRYPSRTAEWRFYKKVRQKLATLPGIESVGMADTLPLRGLDTTGYSLPGKPIKPYDFSQSIGYNQIDNGYLRAMRIAVVRGRGFDARDTAEAAPVTLLNETAARTLFAGRTAIGQRIRFSYGQQPWRTVVGVVEDIRPSLGPAPAAAPAIAYVPYAQAYVSTSTNVVLRTRVEPLAVLPEVRRAVTKLDPEIPVATPQTLDEAYAQALAEPRFRGWLVGGFAGLALALTAVGIFGVLAYSVGGRTREFGVRAALGAEPRQVLTLVLGQALRWVGLGIALGLGLAIGLTRYLAALLYGVSPTNGWILGGVAALMVLVGMGAAWGPARRAMRVDAAQALRCE